MAFKPSRDVSIVSQMADIERNYVAIINSLKGMTPEILLETLDPILLRAQELCPVATGALKNSGYLEVVPTGAGGVISAEIGFAREGEPPYAIFVHEDLTKHHVPPTQAKFLQAAIDEIMPNILDQIGRKYKTGIKLS